MKADNLMEAALPYDVYVRYERPRHGYSWRLDSPDLPAHQHKEIAFRPQHLVAKWNRLYEVCGHVARRALREHCEKGAENERSREGRRGGQENLRDGG